MTKNLVIFTSSFPYWTPTESSFIMPELDALRNKFDNIIIVPNVRPDYLQLYGVASRHHGRRQHVTPALLPPPLLKASHLLNRKVMSLTLSDLSTYSNINQLASGVSFNINAVCFCRLHKATDEAPCPSAPTTRCSTHFGLTTSHRRLRYFATSFRLTSSPVYTVLTSMTSASPTGRQSYVTSPCHA